MLPLLVWAGRSWTTDKLHWLGSALLTVGLLTVGVVIGRELLTWLSEPPPVYRQYPVQRLLAVLAMQSDVPAVQVVAAGLICRLIEKRRKPKVVGEDSCGKKLP